MKELKVVNLTEETETNKGAKPDVDITVVHDEGCRYRFTITAEKGGHDHDDNILSGSVIFTIPTPPASANFSNFQVLNDTAGPLTPGDLSSFPATWTFAPPTITTGIETLIFTAIYTGPDTPFIPITATFSATVQGGNTFTNVPITVAELDPENECPETSPCCEDCDDNPTPVSICPCENKVVAAPVIATPKPSGRILSANISLENTCRSKDVNVAVFLNELIPVPGGEPIETPYAFKIIRMPALPCEGSGCCGCETRTCHCVEFEINDDDTTKCMTRNFVIRTKATTVLSGDEPTCPCECPSDPPTPPEK